MKPTTRITPAVLTAFATRLVVLHSLGIETGAAADNPYVQVGTALIGPIVTGLGSSKITMEASKYEHVATTSYRGVMGQTTHLYECSSKGVESYKTTQIMTGVDNPVSYTDTTPFTFSVGGLTGDVPFEIRKRLCVMQLGSSDYYTNQINAKVTFRVKHEYVANPMYMSPYTNAKISFTQWDLQPLACEMPWETTMSVSIFERLIANNGISSARIPESESGQGSNLRHGANSGIGVTW